MVFIPVRWPIAALNFAYDDCVNRAPAILALANMAKRQHAYAALLEFALVSI